MGGLLWGKVTDDGWTGGAGKLLSDGEKAVAAVETFVGVENFDYGASWAVSLVEKLYAAVPSRGGAYAPMPPATKESLDGLYCDANRDLAATLGRSLPWPCGDAPRRSARGGANGTRVTRRT